jgi:hypothetical protein
VHGEILALSAQHGHRSTAAHATQTLP